MASQASTRIDGYLEKVPEPFRELLGHVRKVVRRAAPDAEEIITYSMPGIGQNGPVVSYCAHKRHCSFYPMGASVLDNLGDEIRPWRTSKGTLQFTPDNPLPDRLIRKIVIARVAANAVKRRG
jgi:uncharacterized protein YdhG (YjbR/CyaY superfamily)